MLGASATPVSDLSAEQRGLELVVARHLIFVEQLHARFERIFVNEDCSCIVRRSDGFVEWHDEALAGSMRDEFEVTNRSTIAVEQPPRIAFADRFAVAVDVDAVVLVSTR